MHEAAEDAESSGDSVLYFLGILQWIVIMGVGALLLIGFGLNWIKNLFNADLSTKTNIPKEDPNEIISKGEFHNGWLRFKTRCGSYGYMDSNGRILTCISPNNTRFNGVQYFNEAEEFVHDVVVVRLGSFQYALIDKFGRDVNKKMENPKNETFIKVLENGLLYYKRCIYQRQGVFDYERFIYNRKGVVVYDGSFEEVKINDDGNLCIKINHGETIVNTQGKLITPFCRKSVLLEDTLYKVFSVKGPCGVFDNSLQDMIIPYGQYGNIFYINKMKLFLCSHYKYIGYERKWSIVDFKGNVLFSINADKVEVLNDNCLLVTNNNQGNCLQGLFSFSGEIILPVEYNEILSSESTEEFLVRKNDSYSLYNKNGKVADFDQYYYVEYITKRSFFKHGGKITGIDTYSSDKDYIRNIDCPVFIKLTEHKGDNIRTSIINMVNEVVVPPKYIIIEELRDSENILTGFKAILPKNGDYDILDINGDVIDNGNIREDEELDNELELFSPGYQSKLHREIEDAIWIEHMNELDRERDLYDKDDYLY